MSREMRFPARDQIILTVVCGVFLAAMLWMVMVMFKLIALSAGCTLLGYVCGRLHAWANARWPRERAAQTG